MSYDDEIDELSPSAPQVVQCRYCGERYLLNGSGDYKCENCGEPLNDNNVDEVPGYCFDEPDDDY